ncbi:AHH domain-containing protein [Stigmatella erecta]|uniref:AHH domain-containing protein n=1 Tax=Stigmatella erecta TaxID=83460 RepID=UPI00318464CA
MLGACRSAAARPGAHQHPRRYHQLIFDELLEATAACRSVVDCRAVLTAQLRRLAKQIATPGTELNQLVTQATPR